MRFFLIVLILLIMASCAPQGGEIRYTRWAGAGEAREFQALVDTYMAENPGTKVKCEFLPWAVYWDKLRTGLLSGSAPDVITLSSIHGAPYITRGAFMPLDTQPGAAGLLEGMLPGVRDISRHNGVLYAIPTGIAVRALVYNRAHFNEAGIPYPDPVEPMAWEEFIEMSRKLTLREVGQVTRYAAHLHKLELWESLVKQAGGEVMDDYKTPEKILINTPAGIEGLSLLNRLITEELIPAYTGEWSGPWGTPDTALITGKVSIMHAGPWGLTPLKEAGIAHGAFPLPYLKQRANRGNVNSLAIFRGSRNPEAAWRFIRWMAGEKGQEAQSETGDLPTLETVYREGEVRAEGSVLEAFYGEYPHVITGPMLPTEEFNTLSDDILSRLFQQRISPAEAAGLLERDGNALLQLIKEE